MGDTKVPSTVFFLSYIRDINQSLWQFWQHGKYSMFTWQEGQRHIISSMHTLLFLVFCCCFFFSKALQKRVPRLLLHEKGWKKEPGSAFSDPTDWLCLWGLNLGTEALRTHLHTLRSHTEPQQHLFLRRKCKTTLTGVFFRSCPIVPLKCLPFTYKWGLVSCYVT